MAEFAGLGSDHAEVEPKFMLAAIPERYISRVLILSEWAKNI